MKMPCSPGMTRCKAACRHYRDVMDYRAARHAAELACEAATGAYPAELAAYGPLLTFKQWLQDKATGQVMPAA